MKAPITLIAIMAGTAAWAQLTITDNLPVSSIAELLEGTGVTITNVEIDCDSAAMGSFIGTSALPIEEGLVLTTGLAAYIPEPWDFFASGYNGPGTDPDLVMIAGNSIHERCILSFDFIPAGDTFLFNFVFASEEYPSYNCGYYNDALGCFLSGPGINGPFSNNAINLALVPGTNYPITINSVNSGVPGGSPTIPYPVMNCELAGGPDWQQNSQYYISNIGGNDVVYNGFTVYLEATAPVQAGETYHLKLAIGDAGNASHDSAVFFEAFSFRSAGITTGVDGIPARQPTLIQGPDHITVQLPNDHGAQELRLLSSTGALISRHRVTSDLVEMSTGGLPAGLYILQPWGDGALRAVRFVR